MTKAYFRVEPGSEPFRVIFSWIMAHLEGVRQTHEYMEEIGAKSFMSFGLDRPTAFVFPRNGQLEGWTKIEANGASRPKKSNKEANDRIVSLAFPPHLAGFITEQFNLARRIMGTTPEGDVRTSQYIGSGFQQFDLAWAVSTRPFGPDWTAEDNGFNHIFLIAPDYSGVLEANRAERPDLLFSYAPEGSTDVMPEGLTQMSLSRMKLCMAESRVAYEEELSQQAAAATAAKASQEPAL